MSTDATLKVAGQMSTGSPVRLRKQVSTPEFRRLTGHTCVGGAEPAVGCLPGCTTTTHASWSPFALGNPQVETLKDLICQNSKGGLGAPWAENRDRPVAGVDIAQQGGQYASYFGMMEHRRRGTPARHGPESIFAQEKGPPITSYDIGFYPRQEKPPRFPISSTTISRTYAEIQKTLGNSKGR
eukprot:TRINITY_DN107288_c0_g1_i1.p1 TRINITY_DN107288_c0_g1~~TRINITY_DN107288_c0_g1_i1.p1  ORF type:complete len:205 (+),score=24.71 TRINITY_DN107288_c0_g1_i1:68-616(+)